MPEPRSSGWPCVLIGSPFLADPLADTLGLAARVVGAVLAAYLLWIPLRTAAAPTGGSRLGWAAEAAVAAAAATVGYGTHGLGVAGARVRHSPRRPGSRSRRSRWRRSWTGRDIVRVGIGLLLLMDGALLVRVGLGGTPGALEQLVTAGLVAGLGGAVAILAVSASRDGGDGFELLAAPGAPAASAPPTPGPSTGGEPGAVPGDHLRGDAGSRSWSAAARCRRPSSAWVGSAAALLAALALDPSERAHRRRGGHRDVGLPPPVPGPRHERRAPAGARRASRPATRRDAPAVTLGTLGAAALALSLADPRIAVLAITAGGLLGGPAHDRPGRGPGGSHRRHPRAAGPDRRRRDGHRRDRVDRPRPQRARGPARRVRPRLSRVRPGGGHPVRRHPVPHLGRQAHGRRARDGPADRHRVGAGGVRGRRRSPGPTVDRAAPRRRWTRSGRSSSPWPSPRSCWPRSPPGSRTTSSTSSATRSSATRASSCSPSRPSTPMRGRPRAPGSSPSSSTRSAFAAWAASLRATVRDRPDPEPARLGHPLAGPRARARAHRPRRRSGCRVSPRSTPARRWCDLAVPDPFAALVLLADVRAARL